MALTKFEVVSPDRNGPVRTGQEQAYSVPVNQNNTIQLILCEAT